MTLSIECFGYCFQHFGKDKTFEKNKIELEGYGVFFR